MSPTKFYLNLEVPEVAQYLERYKPLNLVPQIFASKSVRGDYEVAAVQPIQDRSIEELISGPSAHVKPGQKYNCTATVVGFDFEHPWFYTACKKCVRKLPPAETNLGCQNCNLPPSESQPWYRLEAFVQDDSGSGKFILFGKSGEKLLKATAATLVQTPTMDRQVQHPLMDRVIGDTRIFQVFLKENTFGDCKPQIMVYNIFDKPVVNEEEGPASSELIGVHIDSSESSTSASSSKKRSISEVSFGTGISADPAPKRALGIPMSMVFSTDPSKLEDTVIGDKTIPQLDTELKITNSVILDSKDEIIARDTLLKPVLEKLETPLFDKLATSTEVNLNNLGQHLIDEQPSMSNDCEAMAVHTSLDAKNATSVQRVRGKHKMLAPDEVDDDVPLAEILNATKPETQVQLKKAGITVAKTFGMVPKKHGKPKIEEK